jgi:hypothetical protein
VTKRIDLQQLRAGRPGREDKLLVGADGVELPLPAGMPVRIFDRLQKGEFTEALGDLAAIADPEHGREHAEQFVERENMEMDDIFEVLLGEYGVDLGKLAASIASSIQKQVQA